MKRINKKNDNLNGDQIRCLHYWRTQINNLHRWYTPLPIFEQTQLFQPPLHFVEILQEKHVEKVNKSSLLLSFTYVPQEEMLNAPIKVGTVMKGWYYKIFCVTYLVSSALPSYFIKEGSLEVATDSVPQWLYVCWC